MAANFYITGDSSQLQKTLKAAQAEFMALEKNAMMAGGSIDSALMRLKSFATQWAGMAGVATGGMALLNSIKNVSTEMQNTQAQFKVFLKSAEAADAFMKRLQSYAFNNVFEFSDLAQASAQLMAYGTKTEDVITRLNRLSEVAAGTNKSIGELTSLYNRVKSADVIDSRTETQLKNAGINLRELMGISEGVKMRFKDLDEGLRLVSEDGGMYAGMMEEKMKTLGDSVGLLQDSVTQMLNSLGEKIQPAMKKALTTTSEIVDWIGEDTEEVIKLLGGIATAYGTIKAAMAFDKAFNNAQAVLSLQKEKEWLDNVEKAENEYNKRDLRKKVIETNRQYGGSEGVAGRLNQRTKQRADALNELNDLKKNKSDNSIIEAKQAEIDAYDAEIAKLSEAASAYEDWEKQVTASQYAAAVSMGIMSKEEANQLMQNEAARKRKIAIMQEQNEVVRQDMEDTDSLIAMEIRQKNYNEEELTTALDYLEATKADTKNTQEQISTKESLIAALKDEKLVLEDAGDMKEAAARAQEILNEQEELNNLYTQLSADAQEEANARAALNTAITSSNTTSQELNNLSKKSGAQNELLLAQQTGLASAAIQQETIRTSIGTQVRSMAIASMKALRGQVVGLGAAIKTMMLTNPLGIIMSAVSGLIALGTWLYKIATAQSAAEKQQEAFNESIDEARGAAQSEIDTLDIQIRKINNLKEHLKKAKEGTEEYNDIQKQVNTEKNKLINTYSQYLPVIREEIDSVLEQGAAYNNLRAQIHDAAMERAKMAMEGDLQNDIAENTKNLFKDLGEGLRKSGRYEEVEIGEAQNEIMFLVNKAIQEGKLNAESSKNDIYKVLEETQNETLQKINNSSSISNVAAKVKDYLEDTYTLIDQLNGLQSGSELAMSGRDKISADRPKVDRASLIERLQGDGAAKSSAYENFAEDATEENKKNLDSAEQNYKNTLEQVKKATKSEVEGMTTDMLESSISQFEGNILGFQQENKKVTEDIAKQQAIINNPKASKDAVKAANEQLQKDKERLAQTNATIDANKEVLKIYQEEVKARYEDKSTAGMYEKSINQLIQDEAAAKAELLRIKAQIEKEGLTPENLEALTNAEQTYNKIQGALKTRTNGDDWAQKFKDELSNARKAQENLYIGTIQSEEMKIERQLQAEIKKVQEESSKFSREHNGLVDPKFKKEIENLKIKAQLDKDKLRADWEDWKTQIQKERISVYLDIDQKTLENRLSQASTYSEKQEAKQAIRSRRNEKVAVDNNAAMLSEIDNKVGSSTYESYKSGDLLKKIQAARQKQKESTKRDENLDIYINTLTDQLNQIVAIELAYKNKEEDIFAQNQFSDAIEDVNDYTQRYQNVLNAQLDADREYIEAKKQAIAEGSYTQEVEANLADTRDQKIDKAAKDNGYDSFAEADKESLTQLSNLLYDTANATQQQIRAMYDTAIEEQNNQLKELRVQREEVENELSNAMSSFSAEDQIKVQDLSHQKAVVDTQLATGVNEEGQQLTEEEKSALQTQQLDLEAQLTEYKTQNAIATQSILDAELQLLEIDAQIGQTNQTVNVLTEQRNKATQGALTQSQRSMQNVRKAGGKLADSMNSISKSARAVSNTFGKSLSENAKKAVEGIANIADAAGSSISVIMELIPTITAMATGSMVAVQGTEGAATASIVATSTAAATAIKTVETASVILAIISAVIQIITAIADALSSVIKTQGESMQDGIDKQQEAIDNMQRAISNMDWEAAQKKGTAYWKALGDSARVTKDLIEKTTEQEADAWELYQYYLRKYKEDSDKVKEAKAQWEEMQDQNHDAIDDMRERYDELLEELSGTSLEDFSNSLADALIEGFMNGKDGIEDTWEDLIKDMERQMFKIQLSNALQDKFQGVFDSISKNQTGDGALSTEEIDTIIEQLNAAEEETKVLAERYYDIMSERGLLDDADAEGTEGFGQMTQDTAEALNARFTALQIEGANVVAATQAMQGMLSETSEDVRNINGVLNSLLAISTLAHQEAQEQSEQLRIIAANTALLYETNDRLKSIEQYTSRL